MRINPATGLYFHRGGMLVALSAMSALTIGAMPVIGVLLGRRIRRIARQDMTLMARGEMDPAGFPLAHGSETVARGIELLSWAVTGFLTLGLGLVLLTC